ncbi:unnamed protein product [Paramecium pentaurelia]|uniref:Uncharacterized protein n=1 Tax=Paramecium pentaurelia TaxID=43138 RepID=A0A8S1SY92_9CILI|nr:unnamed protein product [Paramecium pentaurelia]
MNKTKQKQNSLFDLSVIIEKIKNLDEYQSTMFLINKRPNYELLNQSNTQFIPHIINDFEIKRKFKEIQRDSLLSQKPFMIPKTLNKSQIYSKQINTTPNPQEFSIEKKIPSTSFKVQKNIVNKRTKSTDYRIQLKKTVTKDIEAQFLETRNLIKRFNKIKRKSVRFNIQT